MDINYCVVVYLNGPLPEPMNRDDLWAGARYRPMNQGQLCHSSDWTGWETGRIPCKEDAAVMIGGLFMGNHIGFCGTHWLRFLDTIRSELVEARGEEHWLIALAMREYGETLAQQAREAAQQKDRESHRRYLAGRREQRDADALADQLLDGSRVYFIQAGKRGPIKIGVAGNVRKRLDSLQTASPYRLRLRASVFGDERTEAAYHRMFAEHRMHGEWFKPAATIHAEIKAINAVKRRGAGALF